MADYIKETPTLTFFSLSLVSSKEHHCISGQLSLVGVQMSFLDWYNSGGTQKGKCGYLKIFKIQKTPIVCGQHKVALSSQLPLSSTGNWNGRVITTQSQNPSSGRRGLLLTSVFNKNSLLNHKGRHHWSAGLAVVRGGSSGASPVQGLQEHSSTTGFGWDHPDILEKCVLIHELWRCAYLQSDDNDKKNQRWRISTYHPTFTKKNKSNCIPHVFYDILYSEQKTQHEFAKYSSLQRDSCIWQE